VETKYVTKKGSDTNSGLSVEEAFLTVEKGLQESIGGKCIVYEGVYHEGDLEGVNGLALDIDLEGVGNVIIDSSDFSTTFLNANKGLFRHIHFKNFQESLGTLRDIGNFHECIFSLEGHSFQNNTALCIMNESFDSKWVCLNCTFYGVKSFTINSQVHIYYKDCVFEKCLSGGALQQHFNHCASDLTVINTAINGIDTNVYPLPFYPDSGILNKPNLRYDSNHAQYEFYMNNFSGGTVVGSPKERSYKFWGNVQDGVYSDLGTELCRNTLPIYANTEDSYKFRNYDPYFNSSFKSINITTYNNKIYFKEDENGNELVAEINPQVYSSLKTLHLNIKAALESAGLNTYSWGNDTYLDNVNLIYLKSSGSYFALLCNTGLNNHHAWSDLGFSMDEDKVVDTAGVFILSDYALDMGDTSISEEGAGKAISLPILAENNQFYKMGISPYQNYEVTNAEVVSPILTGGKLDPSKVNFPLPTILKRVKPIYFSKNDGVIDSEKDTSIRKCYVRASNTLFDIQAEEGDSLVDMDWIEVEIGIDLSSIFTVKYIYWQVRFKLRNNGTI
jgi:hypothetical protein